MTRCDELVATTPILMYHAVDTRCSTAFRRYCVDPGLFEEHITALTEHGYRTVTITDLLDAEDDGDERPTVALTFDDAFVDFHTTVLPMLADRGLSATLYVPTRFIGSTSAWLACEGESDRRVMGWAQLREASSTRVEVGSHSHSHPQLDLLSPAAWNTEIRDPRAILEDGLQRGVRTFAYPFGYHTRSVQRAVQAAGYRSACAVGDLSNSSDFNRYALSRFTVPHNMSTEDLLERMDTRSSWIDHLRARGRAAGSRLVRQVWPGWKGSPEQAVL